MVVPDLPGRQSEPVERLDSRTITGWLSRLIEMTCHEPPLLVAHSAPGGMAARFAVERGDCLRRLVLVDAAGLGPFRPPPGLLVALLRSVLRPSTRSFERLMRRVMYDLEGVREDEGERWEALARYAVARAVRPSVKRAMRQVARSGTRPIPEAELRQIPVPTELLWGARDRLVPVKVAQAASASLGWSLRVIDDAGHLPHVERPDAFLDGLAATLGSGGRGSSGAAAPVTTGIGGPGPSLHP